MASVRSFLGFVIGTTWVGISRFIFFVTFGVIVNLVLIYFLPDMCDAVRGNEESFWKYLVSTASGCTFSFVMIALFAIGFPMLYIVLGYKYAFKRILQHAYVKNKDVFYEYFTERLTSFIAKKQAKDNTTNSVITLAGRFLQKLNNMPFVLRWVVSFLKDKIPFGSIIEKVALETDLSANSKATVSDTAKKIALEADTYVKDDLLAPDFTLPMILLSVNIIVLVILLFIF